MAQNQSRYVLLLDKLVVMQGMRVLDNACEIGIDKAERPMQLWKTLEA